MTTNIIYNAPRLRLDARDERAWLDDAPIKLGTKSFRLLQALMQSPERMLTKDDLIAEVWDGRAVSDAVLTTAMRELRRALDDDARNPTFIETVHGRGYRFLLPVTTEPSDTKAGTPPKTPFRSAPGIERQTLMLVGGLVLTVALVVFIVSQSIGRTPPEPGPAPETIAATQPKSVLVLPFEDYSPESENQWFASGLTEELITTLGQMSDLRVVGINRGSSPAPTTAAALASDMNLGHAVEGSVRRADGRVRVTVQLSRASDSVVIWSQSYDREDANMITIQESIAYEVAEALDTVTDPERLRAMVETGTTSVAAYEALLLGHYYLGQQYSTGDASYRRTAYENYERARQIDPEFSEAHWLAARYWRERSTYIIPPGEAADYTDAQVTAWFLERVNAAIETETDTIERSKYLAARHIHNLEYAAADQLLRDYLEARPQDAYAWVQQSESAIALGDFDRARFAAHSIAGLSEQHALYRSRVIPIFIWARDIEGSARQADRFLQSDPDNAFVRYHAHRTFLWAGEFDRARALLPGISEGALPAYNRTLARLRQACADLDEDSARQAFDALQSDPGASRASLWLGGYIIGARAAADESLSDLDTEDTLHQLSAWLRYPHFDATHFPVLTARLQANAITPTPPMALPYRCDR